MAARLLHTLADENSDLQKKIGCMNGIFQLFDRHHVLTNRRKSLTLGNAHVNNINFERDSALQVQDTNIINSGNAQLTRVSTESSRVSFSSSCSSSSPLSSDLNKETQPEISPYDRVIFQESPAMSQGSGLGLDLRDVVRDSMYREARGISEVSRHNKRRDDSPRPPYGLKQSTPVDFNESCKALAKLNTSQYYYNEVDLKDASRYYVDSHKKKSKSKKKVKESPKLSLDSRDHLDLKSGNNNKLVESFSRSSSVNKRPPSVVAKLMGLETLPGSPLRRDHKSDPFSRSLRENSMNRTIRLSPSSPRKDLASSSTTSSPRWRSSEFVMKPLSSLRFPIEPAPWKKQACRPVKALLKDLEFKHSVKDLRAINKIVEAMQTKSVKQQECSTNSRGLQSQVMPSSTMRGGPIVIMKPARLVERSCVPSSSLIPIHSLNREEESVNVKRNSTSKKAAKDNRNVTTRSAGAASPRLSHMKKHENEKRSRPPPIPSDSSKSRRQTNKEPATSPGGRRSRQGGRKSQTVIETAKTVVSNLMKNASGDGSSEHPSPVSVLNASIYRDIKPSQASEGTKSTDHVTGGEEDEWNPAYSFSKTTTTLSPEVNRKKLQNVEHLVQKLKRLNSSHDEASQDYIASLCENSGADTDHRYISEILLASGLLLRDLASESTTFQLHSSGHPINPELFLVLEQTKGSSGGSNEKKLNRKLVFDAVNEMLVKKLAIVDAEPWMKRGKGMKRRVLSAQQLLKELCSEIETVQKEAKRRSDNLFLLGEQEEDFLKCMLDEDMEMRSGKWTEFDDVVPGIVLHLERLLFKDLVSEVVHGEIDRLQPTPSRRVVITDS
ncbi:hypothetical protein BRARA_I04779 [Brassica rapa]|uniref:BnaA09g56100D protein n=3 Tax=Brassica TaxID=3705 RepID=A0A078J8G0_BRANA|nr:protein LONGIFOLIA 1 [Brassica rapa]XP_013664616.1 protein LONGIFOLIA 1 [Brassica napus]XP_013664617.1 protein LONGIFOLIA 1 [Brassica napus]XP_018510538.1 protein LONGIFOLIA 1 [Brassica rapa]XP_033136615.1 protein LONGIFOLIA 1 [Brassica rapa]KAH0913005.1 hypothetical protein HID58_036326 [Brassica napus]RID48253.1 hypothetical protein BRARA_I04779 [Brassica rapa]RID48254.1 hypothetical protein BRARA_I04779 [Brassica rapa]CAF2050255.1 unnamed protein product [Brassica napus]CDY59655.1 Bn